MGNNTTSCKKGCCVTIDEPRTQCHRKLTMATCTNPTKRPCIPPSVQVLRISYGRKCSLTGEPTDGWCRMQMGHHIQNATARKQFTNNRRFQVLHILQLEQLRLLNNMYMSTVCQ